MSRVVLALSLLALAGVVVLGLGLFHLNEGPALPPQTLDLGSVVSVADYRLSGPYTHDNLTVFLVSGNATMDGSSIMTLQEALAQKKAVVYETGAVNQLAIENLDSDKSLFIQSGDILKGGQQDRTIPYDTVIKPKSGRVPIESFCVEQGRWSKRGNESSIAFGSSSINANVSEIKRAYALCGLSGSSQAQSQGLVWQNVARTQERLSKKLGHSVKSADSESSLQLTLESDSVRSAITPYLERLGQLIQGRKDVIGYVAVVNGQVLSADIYASPKIFRKVWTRLLEGSAVEAFMDAEAGHGGEPLTLPAVQQFLADVEGAHISDTARTERTYVQIRKTPQAILIESCDRSRENLVLHRSFMKP